jgi:hypothetical protein
LLTKGATMALAIAAMLLVEWRVTDELAAAPLAIFGFVAAVSVLIGARALGSVVPSAPPPAMPEGQRAASWQAGQ